jgi:uncharacterized membrane protein
MKLGTFVLGGLAGAAVIMMMRNRTMTAVTNGFGQMIKQRMNEAKETMMEKGMNIKFSGGITGTPGSKTASASKADARGANSLDDVQRLASRDMKVKQEVNEILEENGQQHL